MATPTRTQADALPSKIDKIVDPIITKKNVDYGKYSSVKGMEMFLERARKIVLKDLFLLFR